MPEMKPPKYMRIQGREIAYRTQKPVGVFVLNWRRIRDGVYSSGDAALYDETHKWFLEHLPEPPFYGENNDNPEGAVTWFKTEAYSEMSEKAQVLMSLLDKYNVPYDIVFSDYVGRIVYEDKWQVGVVDE